MSAVHDVTALTRRAYRLAIFTIVYNVAEGIVSVWAGVSAGLVSLVGFGVDSAIESAVAALVAWRLRARLRSGAVDERRERATLRWVAVSFFLLAGYVVVEGIRSLLLGETPEASVLGIGVLVASLLVMPVLAGLKTRVGRALGDPLVLADAAETKICVLLSASTLVGLIAFQLTGAAWIDPVAGFVIALFAINEGREAWEGDLEHDHDPEDHEHDGPDASN